MDERIPSIDETPRDGSLVVNNSHSRSRSNSSYADSLDADELSPTGSDLNGNESEKSARQRKSRLPIRTPLSPTLTSSDTSDTGNINFEEQNGGLDRQSFTVAYYKLGYIPRSQSVSELCSNRRHSAKETITSRMRFDKHHEDHDHLPENEEYLTPTQRKDQMIKSLKKQVKVLTVLNDDNNKQIRQLQAAMGQGEQAILELKNTEINQIEQNLAVTKEKCKDLTKSYEESVKSMNVLEQTLAELRESVAQQEAKHELMYLEMYRKGQESAKFERDDELEMLATNSKQTKVSIREVVRKLSRTQSELARWQSLKREEIYAEADKPETEADTILRFLKDSFFHFVTGGKDSEDHLRAIVRIFNYPDVQRKKIELARKAHKNSKH